MEKYYQPRRSLDNYQPGSRIRSGPLFSDVLQPHDSDMRSNTKLGTACHAWTWKLKEKYIWPLPNIYFHRCQRPSWHRLSLRKPTLATSKFETPFQSLIQPLLQLEYCCLYTFYVFFNCVFSSVGRAKLRLHACFKQTDSFPHYVAFHLRLQLFQFCAQAHRFQRLLLAVDSCLLFPRSFFLCSLRSAMHPVLPLQ